MKANELRIGNWVRCKIYNGNNDVIIPFAFQEYSYIHLFEPIPITPKILERAGFGRIDYYAGNPFRIGINLDNHFLLCYHDAVAMGCDDSFYNEAFPHVKYLHQLQNLYFALTGTELDINL